MFNGAIIENCIKTFGIERTISFCEMEAHKYELLYGSLTNKESEEAQALLYERDWWSVTKDDLENRMKNKFTEQNK